MKRYKVDDVIFVEYGSIGEFMEYIKNTKTNKSFTGKMLYSNKTDYLTRSFTKTSNFNEAVDLMKNGWSEKAKEMEKTLKLKIKNNNSQDIIKSIYDVTGFQCSVARYLNGIPTSMINQKRIIHKDKVINITKHVGYLGNVSASTIEKESIKALQIVYALEQNGIRVNLFIASPVEGNDKEKFFLKIKIKNSSERMNVSKMAFPLVHPSMLRRLIFRWREVYPEITPSFVCGYGSTINDTGYLRELLKKHGDKEYFIPNFISKDIKKISNTKDLQDLF